MARQPYFVNSSEKQLETFSSFGGGMNTQEHPAKLSDGECQLLENVDIIAAGVVRNRGAYKKTADGGGTITGISQGLFLYADPVSSQVIEAVGGKLYKVSSGVYTNLPITGLATGFQTTRTIEAVQYRNKLYIATGSGLVTYDGTTAALLAAYQPTGHEALYTGTNGYALNPDTYLTDTTNSSSNTILGLKTDQRYGVINKAVTFTAYVDKIVSDTLEYQFSSKYMTDPKYYVWQPWSSLKTYTHAFGKNTDYSIQCEIRKVGTTAVLSKFELPKFRVAATPDATPEPTINFDDMKLCTRILLHYDRMWLYGDTNNPDHLYISHLNNFAYYPRTNIIRVYDELRGNLQKAVRYRNFLICFTDNSIQMITGVSPADFVKSPVHTSIGTIRPSSIQVIKNYIVFAATDGSVNILKSFNYSSTDKLNVERIDNNIRESISAKLKIATKVLSAVYEDQYYLYIQSGSSYYIYRYYYEVGVWVRDVLAIPMSNMTNISNVLNLTSDTNGRIYQLIRGFYFDDVSTVYNMNITTKDFDFGMPHHKKKLKQFQLISKLTSATTVNITITGDDVSLISQSVVGDPTKNANDSQKFNVTGSGRFRYVNTNLSIPVRGEIQLLNFGFIFKQSSPK
jgi:hypothetical protein